MSFAFQGIERHSYKQTAWKLRSTQMTVNAAHLAGFLRHFHCRWQYDTQSYKQILSDNHGQRQPSTTNNTTFNYILFRKSFQSHFRLSNSSILGTKPLNTSKQGVLQLDTSDIVIEIQQFKRTRNFHEDQNPGWNGKGNKEEELKEARLEKI